MPRPWQHTATARTISLYIPPASCILRIITAARIPKHTTHHYSSSTSAYFTLFHIHSDDVFRSFQQPAGRTQDASRHR